MNNPTAEPSALPHPTQELVLHTIETVQPDDSTRARSAMYPYNSAITMAKVETKLNI
jgi:hypothetical protein